MHLVAAKGRSLGGVVLVRRGVNRRRGGRSADERLGKREDGSEDSQDSKSVPVVLRKSEGAIESTQRRSGSQADHRLKLERAFRGEGLACPNSNIEGASRVHD